MFGLRDALILGRIFLQKGEENFSQWDKSVCFQKLFLLFSWFKNIFLISRKIFLNKFKDFVAPKFRVTVK